VPIWRLTLISALALSGSVAAQAQDSQESDSLEGKASLGYLATKGNTDSENANAAFSIKWQPSLWSHEFNLSAIRAQTSGETTAQAQFADYVARRDFGEKSFLFTSVDWRSDKFSAYDSQLSETVGYGRHILDSERHEFDFEIGAGARQAELRDGASQDESIARLGFGYAWHISETAEFTQGLVIESGSSNTNTDSLTELRADIIGNLALVLSYRIRNNTDVPAGTEKTDRFTAISLEYGF